MRGAERDAHEGMREVEAMKILDFAMSASLAVVLLMLMVVFEGPGWIRCMLHSGGKDER